MTICPHSFNSILNGKSCQKLIGRTSCHSIAITYPMNTKYSSTATTPSKMLNA